MSAAEAAMATMLPMFKFFPHQLQQQQVSLLVKLGHSKTAKGF